VEEFDSKRVVLPFVWVGFISYFWDALFLWRKDKIVEVLSTENKEGGVQSGRWRHLSFWIYNLFKILVLKTLALKQQSCKEWILQREENKEVWMWFGCGQLCCYDWIMFE